MGECGLNLEQPVTRLHIGEKVIMEMPLVTSLAKNLTHAIH